MPVIYKETSEGTYSLDCIFPWKIEIYSQVLLNTADCKMNGNYYGLETMIKI